jgi:hypothetical protein
VEGGRCAKAARCNPGRIVKREMFELQRPAWKRLGLKQRKFLDDDAIDRWKRCLGSCEVRRIQPERGVLILMIDFRDRVSRVRDLDRMMLFEMAMNELGAMVIVRLADVDMLRRQHWQAKQAEDRERDQGAGRGHCRRLSVARARGVN